MSDTKFSHWMEGAAAAVRLPPCKGLQVMACSCRRGEVGLFHETLRCNCSECVCNAAAAEGARVLQPPSVSMDKSCGVCCIMQCLSL